MTWWRKIIFWEYKEIYLVCNAEFSARKSSISFRTFFKSDNCVRNCISEVFCLSIDWFNRWISASSLLIWRLKKNHENIYCNQINLLFIHLGIFNRWIDWKPIIIGCWWISWCRTYLFSCFLFFLLSSTLCILCIWRFDQLFFLLFICRWWIIIISIGYFSIIPCCLYKWICR